MLAGTLVSMLKTKSVDSPIERGKDGLRILATRFRGRGMPTSRYDVWMANLGPSEKLLRATLAEEISHAEFVKRYVREMVAEGEPDARNRTIKNHGQKFTLRLIKHLASKQNVTLMCHCAEDNEGCHRHALRTLILSNKI
jgi:uncharacterized protein YeaO (DUF488 family)